MTIGRVFFLVELKHLCNAFSVHDTIGDLGMQGSVLKGAQSGLRDSVKLAGNN